LTKLQGSADFVETVTSLMNELSREESGPKVDDLVMVHGSLRESPSHSLHKIQVYVDQVCK
jgi:hypothetical protein